jgi:hypothetical protein
MKEVVTHAFGLADTGRAMEMAGSREDEYIKGIVVPDFTRLEHRGAYRSGR